MADYIPTAGTLPDGFCPTSWQSTLNQFASLLVVSIPTANGVLIQDAEPAVDERDQLWIKTLPAEPYVEGAFVYKGGKWQAVPGQRIYFQDTGVANAMVVDTGEGISSTAFLLNRLFLIRVAAANTGATTLAVDSLAAAAVKKQNGVELAAGDIKAGQLALIAWDGTDAIFEVLTTLPDATPSTPSWETSSDYVIPAPGAAITVPHSFGKVPEIIKVVAVCQVATDGYAVGNEVGIEGMSTDVSGGDEDVASYTVSADSGNITIAACTESNGMNYTAKAGGLANWKTAYPKFKFRVYSMAFP